MPISKWSRGFCYGSVNEWTIYSRSHEPRPVNRRDAHHLYALLDYLHADWPPKLVQDWFNLTDQQMVDVLTYLAEHRGEVEHEYQQVLHQAEANREYWEARNRERLAYQTSRPASPEQEALRAKLRAWKSQLRQPSLPFWQTIILKDKRSYFGVH